MKITFDLLMRLITPIFIFLGLCASAFSEEEEEMQLAYVEKNTPNLINNCVCTVSGAYVDGGVDFSLPGPSSLVLERCYSSRRDGGSFGIGWGFANFDALEWHGSFIKMGQWNGRRVTYEKHKSHYYLNNVDGMTNLSHGFPSGRTNIKNQTVSFSDNKDAVIIQTASEEERKFSRVSKSKKDGDLWQEVSRFSKDNNGFAYIPGNTLAHLERIEAKNNTTGRIFNHILFTDMPRHKLKAQATGDLMVTYAFKKNKAGDLLLEQVKKNGGYFEKYTYDEDKIVLKEMPDNRYVKIEYYSENDKSRYKNKVKALYGPSTIDGEPQKLYSFEYSKNTTHVFDSKLNETRYAFDSKGRLSQIITYVGGFAYRLESYFFGKGDDEGNLTAKIFSEPSSMRKEGLFLTYDKYGNVIKRCLYGYLSGKNTPPLVTNGTAHPTDNGCEREKIVYTYTSHNMIKSEERENGLKILYKYHSRFPHKVIAKFTCEGDIIKKREFFRYDTYGSLIYKSEDDGSSKEEKNINGVSEKRCTRIVVRDTAPFGFPFKTQEFAVDLQTGREILLQWKEEEFSREGRLLSSKLFGSDGALYASYIYDYDLFGNRILEVDPLGREVKRVFDKNGNVIREITPEYTCENSYDLSNRLILQTKSVPNEGAQSVRYTYNTLGKIKRSFDAFGHETRYLYDALGRLKEKIAPDVINEKGEWVRPVEKVYYDIADRPIIQVDALGRETKTQFTTRGLPFEIIYPDKTKETFVYDFYGNLIEKREKTGIKKLFTYDYLGRPLTEQCQDPTGKVLSSVTHTYNAFHCLSSEDSEGNLTLYTYDAAGRLSTYQKGDTLIQYVYDGIGRVSMESEKVDEGIFRHTYKKYDALSRQIEERIESSSGELLHCDVFEYDGLGNKVYEQSGSSFVRKKYNGFGYLKEMSDSLGRTTHITYYFEGVNERGQRVLKKETTDPSGNLIDEVYDTHGRVVAVTKRSPLGGVVDHKTLRYDALGHLCLVCHSCHYLENASECICHQFEYDASGFLIKEVLAASTPQERITSYVYNKWGQKSKKIKPDGVEISYHYDCKGRVERLCASDGTIDYRFTYNSLDQLTLSTDLITAQTTELSYDKNGRVIHEKLANGLSIDYKYDCGGRTREVILPDTSSIQYGYDCLNLKEIHRIKGEKRIYSHYETEQNLLGQTTCAILPTLQKASFSFDKLGRPNALHTPSFSQIIPDEGFDASGNVISVVSQGKWDHFSYDFNDQLSGEPGSVYESDSLGNRRSHNGVQYRYNALNQLIAKGSSLYSYDKSGNLIRKVEEGVETLYTYDALDRLRSVTQGGESTFYNYDGSHRRISETNSRGEERRFLYIGDEEAGFFEQDTLVQLKVLGKGKRHPAIAMEMGDRVYIPVRDLFGNTVQLLSLEGDVLQTFRFTAFGEMTIEQGPVDPLVPWLFSGKRLEASGLYSFGLRFYDPSIGRWLSMDPAGFEDGDNLYAYVKNNPLIFFDERGLFSLWDGISTAASFAFDTFCLAGASILDFSEPKVYCTNDLIDPKTGKHYDFPNPPKGVQAFANGILNTESNFNDSLAYISQTTGYNTMGVFTPTRGIFADAVIYFAELFGYHSRGSRTLQHCLEKYTAEGPVLLIAHSRGCVSARNALSVLDESSRGNIHYLALCPGGFSPACYADKVFHLCSASDPVTHIDFMGRVRCAATIIEIQRHEDAFFIDHSVTSPTLKPRMEAIIDAYYNLGLGKIAL